MVSRAQRAALRALTHAPKDREVGISAEVPAGLLDDLAAAEARIVSLEPFRAAHLREAEIWQIGDRVRVAPMGLLADGRPRGGWSFGTVEEVNPPGLRAGVRVRFDRLTNGVATCFATHGELSREALCLDCGRSLAVCECPMVGEAVGLRSASTVCRHLGSLVAKGLLVRRPYEARGYRLAAGRTYADLAPLAHAVVRAYDAGVEDLGVPLYTAIEALRSGLLEGGG